MAVLACGVCFAAVSAALHCSSHHAGAGAAPPDAATCPTRVNPLDVPMFHGDRARLGWNSRETDLTPASVAGGGFGLRWNSDALDPVTFDGVTVPAHVYGSPLYLDGVTVTSGPFAGTRLSLVFLATTCGYAYAINAFDAACGAFNVPAGAIVWRTRLGTAGRIGFDGDSTHGGMPLGVLGTPVIDRGASPPRMYVVSIDAGVFRAYALDVASGNVLPRWPVAIDAAAVEPFNGNAPQTFESPTIISQRGALNLSPSGDVLYVPFGAYSDDGVGFMVAVDTRGARVLRSFAGANASTPLPQGMHWIGGMWSAGGPSVDAAGSVYSTVGNSPDAVTDAPGVWGQSLLRWSQTLDLVGTYTPFNYHLMDVADADLAGSSPVVLPDLDPATTSTPHLVAFGAKQGNVYLVDRDKLPGTLTQRPPPGGASTSDRSLYSADPQVAYGGAPGPLNVFGPYSEVYGNLDHAKMRTTPAYFRGGDGTTYLFVTGATKAAVDSQQSVPPCVARLRVALAPGMPAYLTIDLTENTLTFVNPGSPVVTSNGPDGAILWMTDENAPRVASLTDPAAPHPVLHAVDATTMTPLWRSPPDELKVGGKYSSPTVVHGTVFVATDRLQAYGLRP